MTEDNEKQNYITFRDCLSTVVIEKLAVQPRRSKAKRTKGRKNEIKPVAMSAGNEDGNDAEELADFSEVKSPRPHPCRPSPEAYSLTPSI